VNSSRFSAGAAVVARGLGFRYGAVVALEGLDLELAPGAVTAVLGPNGAGKSTFVALTLGLAQPASGRLEVLGHTPGTLAARRATGAMLQNAALAEQLTVREHLELQSGYYARPRPVGESLGLAGLERLADRRYAALSGGEQRRVQFAIAICGRPQLLVLDEPTVALDTRMRHALWAVVREVADEGTAVLLTTHQLEEAEALADRVVLLAAGRVLADGPPARIRARVGARRIQCQTRLPIETLRDLPGVIEARGVGRLVALRTSSAELTLRALLAADETLADVEVTGASLEDAVLDLVRPEAA
jgi:ABC-2 type transport system ATP-binding protein